MKKINVLCELFNNIKYFVYSVYLFIYLLMWCAQITNKYTEFDTKKKKKKKKREQKIYLSYDDVFLCVLYLFIECLKVCI
jgi:uncharacterized membrane protein